MAFILGVYEFQHSPGQIHTYVLRRSKPFPWNSELVCPYILIISSIPHIRCFIQAPHSLFHPYPTFAVDSPVLNCSHCLESLPRTLLIQSFCSFILNSKSFIARMKSCPMLKIDTYWTSSDTSSSIMPPIMFHFFKEPHHTHSH